MGYGFRREMGLRMNDEEEGMWVEGVSVEGMRFQG